MKASQIGVLVSALSMAVPSRSAMASPADESTESLYTRGDRAYQNGRFVEAAELWHRALDSQAESEETSATRANMLAQLLTAYTDAFAEDRDRDHLATALEIASAYERELSQVYGAAWSLPPHVDSAVRDVERLLEQYDRDHLVAEREATSTDAASHSATVSDPSPLAPSDLPPTNGLQTRGDGRALFRGGVATTLVGVAALGPAIWGAAASVSAINGRRQVAAEAEDMGIESAEWAALDKAGWFDTTEGTIAVASAAAAAVLVTAGTVMIILAFRKARLRANVGPRYVFTPRYAGAGLGLTF